MYSTCTPSTLARIITMTVQSQKEQHKVTRWCSGDMVQMTVADNDHEKLLLVLSRV